MHDATASPLPEQPPVYLSAHAAGRLIRSDHRTLARHVEPAGYYTNQDGGKAWPLYDRDVVIMWDAERKAKRQAGAQ